MNQKKQTELAIFLRFAEGANVGVEDDSITQPEPPAPDILCCLASGECVAFELVELVDESLKYGPATASEIEQDLKSAVAQLPSERIKEFNEKYRGKNIGVQFEPAQFEPAQFERAQSEPALTRSQRKKLTRSVIGVLLDANYQPDEDGMIRRRTYKTFPKDLRYIHLTASYDHAGPTFGQVAVDSFTEKTRELLKRKSEKQYDSQHPIELVGYYDNSPEPMETELPYLDQLVTGMIGASPFRRVWLYSNSDQRIIKDWVH